MREVFAWVPWFRKLAKKIGRKGQQYLAARIKEVDWHGGRPPLLRVEDENIDPFSFFATLSTRNSEKNWGTFYKSVSDVFGISDVYARHIPPRLPPTAADPNKRGFYFPVIDARNTLFYEYNTANSTLLWHLFKQALSDSVSEETFAGALEIKGVGIAKLTQTLFLVDPTRFHPFDDHSALSMTASKHDAAPSKITWSYYRDEMERIPKIFPGCECYEINMICYLWKKGEIPIRFDRFFQVSTNVYNDKVNRWEDFKDNFCVYTGGPGGREEWPERDSGYGGTFGLRDPKRGDIVLVRFGVQQGHGIGIVYKNDHHEEVSSRSKIHVLWLNKKTATLACKTRQTGFSKVNAGDKTLGAFREATPFSTTLDWLEEVARPVKPPNIVEHPLNQILYGPPGTGKTWHTVTRAVAIIESRKVRDVEEEDRPAVKGRFEQYRRAGQVEMVTFHQNTTYEDFVEGIRPVLVGPHNRDGEYSPERQHTGEVQYEMFRGVFPRIAERAKDNRNNERYVLIIDEINRGNIARIFGELITLIEDSKRIDQYDEAWVTLPSSNTDFGVPANLHVLGTMNTADRSIALLDTALRRRFVFVEMMPDPSHSDIANDLDGIDCEEVLKAMNRRIAVLLDREHQIGHTYFLRVKTLPALARTFRYRIMPLLQEYFYDDWEKIRAVLNDNGFVRKSDPPEELVRLDLVDSDRNVYDLTPDGHDRWTDPSAYRRIYETAKTGDADEAQGD